MRATRTLFFAVSAMKIKGRDAILNLPGISPDALAKMRTEIANSRATNKMNLRIAKRKEKITHLKMHVDFRARVYSAWLKGFLGLAAACGVSYMTMIYLKHFEKEHVDLKNKNQLLTAERDAYKLSYLKTELHVDALTAIIDRAKPQLSDDVKKYEDTELRALDLKIQQLERRHRSNNLPHSSTETAETVEDNSSEKAEKDSPSFRA